MQFTDTQIHILKKIALAPSPVCGFDLSNRGDKSTRLMKDSSNRADFTLTFRHLARVSQHDASGDTAVRDLFLDRAAFDAWANDYRAAPVP